MENKNYMGIVRKVFSVIFWIVIIALFIIWGYDFYRVKTNQSPVGCIKTIKHQYKDGTTTECIGAGYKVYEYNRKSIGNGKEFGAFYLIDIKE